MREIDNNSINSLNFKGIQKASNDGVVNPESPAVPAETKEIKDLWISEQTYSFSDPSFNRTTYKEKVQEIVNGIVDGATIFLSDTIKRNGGNFDDKVIKKLCDKHGIRYNASDDKGDLFKVKNCRNQLAHGVDSFSNYACDMTTNDLKHIMEGVVSFINGILSGMEIYYKDKLFLADK